MKVKGFDNQQLSNDVAEAMQNFSNNNLNTDINNIVSQWTFALKHVIDSHCPRIKKRVKREKQPGWITDDLIDLMHMRDLAKRRGQHNNYKHFRNRVTIMLKENKSKYYKERVESCKDEPRKLVSLFNELGIKQTSDKSINKIVHDNKEVTDFKIIAELFNNHFSSIMEKYVTDSDFKQYPFIPTKVKQYVDSKVPMNTYFLESVVNLS